MDKRINKVSDEFICPYCLKPFKLNKIMFRPPVNGSRKLFDKRLSDYWSGINGEYKKLYTEAPIYPRSRKRGLFTIKNSAGENVPYTYVNEVGVTYDTRVCPNCHNVLAPNAGFVNTANILIIGENSEHCYKYARLLLKSLCEGTDIKNVSFFLAQKSVSSSINNIDSITQPLLFGKLVYSLAEKTLCEFTITYLPLSANKLDNYAPVALQNIFTNVDALIFAVDIEEFKFFRTLEAGEEPERDTSDNPVHKYLYRINEYVGQVGQSDLDIPVGVIITGLERINQVKRDPEKATYLKGSPTLIYENELQSGNSKKLIQSVDNVFVQQLAKCFKNIGFFSSSSLSEINSANIRYLQNPLRWIVEEFDCKPDEPKADEK